MQPYKYMEHTADCKFQAYGSTLEEAFANAVYAMMNHLTPVDKIKPKTVKQLSVNAPRIETLLYDFLEEFLFFIDTEGFLAGHIKSIKIRKEKNQQNTSEVYSLRATILGDSLKNYQVNGDIKAITYNDMFVKQEKGKCTVQVVIDI